MAGRGSQKKGNLDKIKREMTAKKQKAQQQKQGIETADLVDKDLSASAYEGFGQAQDRSTESVTEMMDKDKNELQTEKEVEEELQQKQQDISEITVDTKRNKFVVFRVEEEEFALKVSDVKEIIRIPQVTKLPNLPEYISGLCSLRGGLLPVIDCRTLFGMPKQNFSENSRIIVTDIYGKNVGLISDKVLEVIDVDEAAVKEPPASFKGINGGVLNGIIILEDGKRVLMQLAAEKMINVDGIYEAMREHPSSVDNLGYSQVHVHEDEEEQIVIFNVGTEEYAFNIDHVKEIIRLPEVLKVPNTADYIEGVFSIRNELMAVINMRKLLGREGQQLDEQSRVIIINNGNYSYGLIVDRVSNVVQVQKRLLKGNTQNSKLIKGIYNLNQGHRLIIMLETQKLISSKEVQEILNADQKKVEKDKDLSGEANNRKEYVVFKLAGEEYGIWIQNVQEVNRISEITHFPGAPDYIAGMVDLRGEIIPILNLRKKFDLQEFEAGNESKFIVVEEGNKKIGILVDFVSGVMRFSADYLEEVLDTLKGRDKDSYIDKIAKLNDGKRVVMLLNLQTMLSFM